MKGISIKFVYTFLGNSAQSSTKILEVRHLIWSPKGSTVPTSGMLVEDNSYTNGVIQTHKVSGDVIWRQDKAFMLSPHNDPYTAMFPAAKVVKIWIPFNKVFTFDDNSGSYNELNRQIWWTVGTNMGSVPADPLSLVYNVQTKMFFRDL